MLHGRGLTRAHGGQLILDRVDVKLDARDRVGVVGPNGVGKSTLLRILAGAEAPDQGRVERAPVTLTVGYLPQELDPVPGEVVRDYLARRTGVADASASLDRWTAALERDPTCVDQYTDALEHFLALGGDDFDARAAETAAQVGLIAARSDGTARLEQPMATLSGGEGARALLAAILLSRFDVLLLDEPTNNLDFAGLDQLEAFVSSTPAAVMVVSHDRAFLDGCVRRVIEIDEHAHTAREFTGGWSEYVDARDLARRQQYAAHDRYTAERDRLRARARRQIEWSETGVRKAKKSDEPDKNIRAGKIARSEKQASKVKATERKIEQLEVVDKPWEGWQLRLQLAPSARSGDVVARLDGSVIERGDFRLGPLDVEIGWQERIGILGANGSGKSTLLGALLGQIPLADGRRWLGPGVVIGELDQSRGRYAGDEPLLDTFIRTTALPLSDARSLLAKFGLTADHVARPGDSLSPGERSRALLAELMASGVNCLVLDEPTNHLDLAAIEQLELALDDFEGTLLVVSHDRRFLDALHLTRTIDL